jgi:hypothetical protein
VVARGKRNYEETRAATPVNPTNFPVPIVRDVRLKFVSMDHGQRDR